MIFKSLVGDKSDNIKGVKGIGNITAVKILKYKSIPEFITNHPNLKFSNILISKKKLIELNKSIDISKIKFKELPKTIYKFKTYEIIENIGER